jgi:hypothetical protein
LGGKGGSAYTEFERWQNVLSLIFLVFAFVLAVIAGFRPPNNPPFEVLGWRLLCIALAAFFLANLLGSPAALKLLG